MDYRIFTDLTTENLEKIVKRHLKKGWIPKGGVCSLLMKDNHYPQYQEEMIGYQLIEPMEYMIWAQAMIKPDKGKVGEMIERFSLTAL